MAFDECLINLRPVELWIQIISTNRGSDILMATGDHRSLRVDCKVEQGDVPVVLSDGRWLHHMSVELAILPGSPREENNLERGIGRFSLFNTASVSAWFYLPELLYADILEEVRHGGYSDCRIVIAVAPLRQPLREWDVSSSRLFILAASVEFTRKVLKSVESFPSGP
jgi:hypothetical protein